MERPPSVPLRESLLAARNPDGGWGYLAGKKSRIEPTSIALIALSAERATAGTQGASKNAASAVDGRAVFSRFERHSGLLMDPGAMHPNIAFNGIAALAAQHPPLGGRELAASLTSALLQQKGTTLKQSKEIVQDNSLVGWPWMDGTFSWVEPTAWCLLAIKRWAGGKRTGETADRIDQAERLLRDRACQGGGWNYGNRLVMDKPLRPYASTSALALLALQDSPADPVVRTSRETLRRLCERERSGYALALACLAFARLGEPATDVEASLTRVWEETGFGGEVVATALALYVVEGRESRYEAFAV